MVLQSPLLLVVLLQLTRGRLVPLKSSGHPLLQSPPAACSTAFLRPPPSPFFLKSAIPQKPLTRAVARNRERRRRTERWHVESERREKIPEEGDMEARPAVATGCELAA
jgi:hypothetical protein